MKLLSNAHCHTTYCDGKNSPEEMIRAAIDRNFISLGFSIHGWAPYELCDVSLEKEAQYRAELKQLREKYRDQIEIIIGAERDTMYERSFEGYEYLIDSTHWFQKDGIMMPVDAYENVMVENVEKHFGGDFYAYCRAYYEKEADVCAKSDALFIGHIDLVSKFNEGGKYFDESDPRYYKPALEAAACAIERRVPLEINTGAIPRGYRSIPYPHPIILKYIQERGGEIIINSDAHFAAGMDAAFDEALELARSCGFKHILRLRSTGLEEIGI